MLQNESRGAGESAQATSVAQVAGPELSRAADQVSAGDASLHVSASAVSLPRASASRRSLAARIFSRGAALFFAMLMTALVLRALHWNRALSMDLTVMREVALLRSHNLSRAILWMTHAGDGGWLTVLSLAAGLAMVLRGRLAWAFYLWGTSVGAALSSSMVKHLVMRHRPDAALHHALAMATSWSLPSGHAMQSAAVYSALAVLAFEAGLRWKWQVALALATLTAVVAFSRVYLGVHYPTDVFIGCGLGLAWPLGLRSLMVRQSELVRAPIAAEATGERLTP